LDSFEIVFAVEVPNWQSAAYALAWVTVNPKSAKTFVNSFLTSNVDAVEGHI
jgi:hypothetical protein